VKFDWYAALLTMVFVAGLLYTLSAQAFGPYDARLVRVVDGDTVELDMDVYPDITIRTHLRINGINSPELRGSLCEKTAGQNAREYARKILAGAYLRVVNVRHGKFAGRMVGDLWVNDRSFAEIMIETGHAVAYDGGKREKWCKEDS